MWEDDLHHLSNAREDLLAIVPETARVEAKNADPEPMFSGGMTNPAMTMAINSIQPTKIPTSIVI